MKARERAMGFKPRSLKIAAAAAEIARTTGLDITVDLFCPRRACYRCAQKAEVFIGPKHVCASCWVQLVTRCSGLGANNVRAQLPAITAALAGPTAAKPRRIRRRHSFRQLTAANDSGHVALAL